MATPKTIADAIESAVAAMPDGGTRMLSDYRTDLSRLGVAETGLQIQIGLAGPDPEAGSNATRVLASVTVLVHHRLASVESERAYTEGNLQVFLDAVSRRSWWRSLSGVYDLTASPEVEIGRLGNVISTTVTATVSVTP